MSKVYESLKGAFQETLQRSKSNPTPPERVNQSHESSFAQAIEELEKAISEKLAILKTGVAEGEQIVEKESGRAEQAMTSLRENITTLEGRLKESEDTARKKNSASQEMEKSLNGKIRRLETDVNKKSDVLRDRDAEVKSLKSNVDVLVKRATELEGSVNEAQAEAAKQTTLTEQMATEYRTKIATLEARAAELNELVRDKESVMAEIERNLTDKIQEFENRLRDKEKLLLARDSDMKELKSQVQLLTRGVKEMSSFFKQAEALASVEKETLTSAAQPDKVEGKSPAVESSRTTITTNGTARK